MEANQEPSSAPTSPEPSADITTAAPTKKKRGGVRISKKSICGAKSKSTGKPCPRVAGWGTDHKGAGKCRSHGGSTPVKHGLYSRIIPEEYREQYDALRLAPDTNSLTHELAYLRIVLMRLEKKHGTNADGTEKAAVMLGEVVLEPLQMIAECIEQISRVVKRKNDMEEGTKITFSLTELKEFSDAIIQAIIKHVSNPETVAAIKCELAAYFAGQASPRSV